MGSMAQTRPKELQMNDVMPRKRVKEFLIPLWLGGQQCLCLLSKLSTSLYGHQIQKPEKNLIIDQNQ